MAPTKKIVKTKSNKDYPALRFSQRGKQAPALVMFHAPVNEILEWAAVGELGPTKNGPQRERNDARVEAIAKFLDSESKNIVPTAIILAFTKGMASFSSSTGILSVEIGNGHAATIVDGQHRLYGIKEFKPTTEVAVVAIMDADAEERAFQFLVVNNKSTRVSATHTKALIATMKKTALVDRLRSAKIAFDVAGINDVDLVNSDKDSPFFKTIDWTTTPKAKRIVQATAIELSLNYLGGIGISEFDDRDIRRSVFLTIWKTIKEKWGNYWYVDSRLISKVGIICLTRYIADRITSWADNEELEIDVTDLKQIADQTKKIVAKMDTRFWTTPWAEKAQGGFDTTQGRERVFSAITQLYRNGLKGLPWYTDIEILDTALAKKAPK
jgi:DGQHR domain-containing protein